ncbi:hypothetical protein BT96DRAFT_498675 [Gymnopus androsaceus JB14]|uniref:Uncharacterized protein n=1 Tax=Gymnopus androsaceus JB14 TaxID=1447944 RepID=A0A6A4HXF1_9AGAR|nr:hypothetical protein BT96DRAFT_498675 [Gymnopus androsaceus JB14]
MLTSAHFTPFLSRLQFFSFAVHCRDCSYCTKMSRLCQCRRLLYHPSTDFLSLALILPHSVRDMRLVDVGGKEARAWKEEDLRELDPKAEELKAQISAAVS